MAVIKFIQVANFCLLTRILINAYTAIIYFHRFMLIVLEKYILLRSMLQTSKNQVFSSFLLDTQSVILWHYTCTYLNIVTLSYNSNWNSM